METSTLLQVIGTYHCDFSTKFGLPRQSGLAEDLEGWITFAPPFQDPNYLRGIEGYSHLWLLWQFSAAKESGRATVRPPKQGGNTRYGVFATRSPFRPNRIGLSCVRLVGVERTPDGAPLLRVRGGDLMDGTPIFDVKPYLAYADAHPDATGGISAPKGTGALKVEFPPALAAHLPQRALPALKEALAADPRPGYHDDPARVYVLPYAGFEVCFSVAAETLTVCDVRRPKATENP